MTKKNLRNKIIKASTVVAVFGASLTSAFFLTPNAVKKGTFNIPDETEADDDKAPHFSQFVAKLTNDTGIIVVDANMGPQTLYLLKDTDSDTYYVNLRTEGIIPNTVRLWYT